MPLTVGTDCPRFKLPDQSGAAVNVGALVGKQPFVIYFYPKADTPGCTVETCGFRDAIASYRKADVAVFGISPDPVSAVAAFAEKFQVNFPLLADEHHTVCEAFGVWVEKQNFGNAYMGVARTTFVVGNNGRIAHVFEKVDPQANHDQQVLAWVRQNLSAG